MKAFNKAYLWAADMKYHMAIYTVAAVFVKSIFNFFAGKSYVETLSMFQMLLVSLFFACAESVLFPHGKEWGVTGWRVAVWAVLANVLYIGGAIVFGWFPGISTLYGILLIVIMECGLFAMWYVLWLKNKRDDQRLNCKLKKLQNN